MSKRNKEEQFFQHMEKLIGSQDARALIDSLDTPSPKAVRFNRKRCSIEQVNRFKGRPVPWNKDFGRYWAEDVFPSRTLEYTAGLYYIQEASAMLAVAAAETVLDFKDKNVLDLTAAPGGKSTQMAERLGSGYLTANEVVNKRVDALNWNVNRHRLNNVLVTSLPTEALARELQNVYHIVLVDAPCSGEGLFQKKKNSPLLWSAKNVKFCAKRQQTILADAANMVAPGGYLIYSTCTFSKEENEDRILPLLENGFEPAALPDSIPVSPAISDDPRVMLCSRRIFPHRQTGAGAFVSVIRKTAGTDHLQSRCKYFAAKEEPLKGSMRRYLEPGDGFLFEKNGVISLFNHHRIPEFIYKNAFQIGAPLYDKRKDNELMFGSVQAAAPEVTIALDAKQADDYTRGLELTLDLPDGIYFVSYQAMILGLVKTAGGKASNKLPRPLRRV